MAYQGNSPAANFQSLPAVQRFNGTGSATAFTLASVIPNDQSILVSVDGVTQDSNAYAVSGTTLTFTAAPSSGTGNIFVNTISPVGSTVVPPDGSVTTAKLAAGVLLSWQAVQTSAFTAVASRGYPCNTTSSAFTVTLPSSANVGDSIQIVDYAGTFNVNNITLTSSLNIEGRAADKELTTNREGVTITYVDATQGWVASSGVNSGTQAIDPIPYSADFLVIAGGGGGGAGGSGAGYAAAGGGGGAGGYRTSTQTVSGGETITVTVGDGGAGGGSGSNGATGSISSISATGLTTITSAGGGGGGRDYNAGVNGGSGGGGGGEGGSGGTAGTGNTPSTSPSQGNNGGAGGFGSPAYGAGGGGGSGAGGQNGSTSKSGNGGAGTASSITGSSVTRAGGGGGANYSNSGAVGGSGGGGTDTYGSGSGGAGTANTGSGGSGSKSSETAGAGGKGVIILSIPDASYSGTTTGSPTVATGVSGKTVLTFNGSGSYTV